MPSLLFLLALAQDPALGERVVNTDQAAFYARPTRTSQLVRQAELGELVTVTAIEADWAKSTLSKGETAYIRQVALIVKEKFKVAAADDEQARKLAAQNQEGQRGLNPATEAEHRKLGGAQIDAAYKTLDELRGRSTWIDRRGPLEEKLTGFRKAGKMGEFSSVK